MRHGAAMIGRHLWPRRSLIVQAPYGTFIRTDMVVASLELASLELAS
jgi:hypothetical protein